MTADTFLEIIRRYTDAQELMQRMVTELIDHIDVYQMKQDSTARMEAHIATL